MIFYRKPLRGYFCEGVRIPPVAAYGVNWGLLAISPTGFFGDKITFFMMFNRIPLRGWFCEGVRIPPVTASGG